MNDLILLAKIHHEGTEESFVKNKMLLKVGSKDFFEFSIVFNSMNLC